MKLSIVVPVYGVEAYLRGCVDSILAQTFSDFECILVDDGARDGSPAICDEYAAKDPRVRVIHKPNGGLQSARKAGILAAQGEYIGNVDGDDTIAPTMYQEMLSAAELTGADVVYCDFAYVYPDGHTAHPPPPLPGGVYGPEALDSAFFDRRLYHCSSIVASPGTINSDPTSKLIRAPLMKRAASEIDERTSSWGDPLLTYLSILRAGTLTVLAGRYLYNYYQRAGSGLRSYFPNAFSQTKEMVRLLQQENAENDRVDISAYIDRVLVLNSLKAFFMETLLDKPTTARESRTVVREIAADSALRHAAAAAHIDGLSARNRLLIACMARGDAAGLEAVRVGMRLLHRVKRLLGREAI